MGRQLYEFYLEASFYKSSQLLMLRLYNEEPGRVHEMMKGNFLKLTWLAIQHSLH